jgi:hypothetical protein
MAYLAVNIVLGNQTRMKLIIQSHILGEDLQLSRI